ncbi:hypothetical protein [Paraburkholderia sp. HP33-1]|uniref:hypothetical protein n=1 Tax=Paraburkholderia sp. HP33-1 TaxID=2883243 RepID=UPI001F482C28|nr:hypothetical protein [Paraburkholderia sp. HP33-1]
MNEADLNRMKRLLKNASNAQVRLRLQQTARIDPAARLAFESIEAARRIVDKEIDALQARSNPLGQRETACPPTLLGGKRKLRV